MDVSHLNKYESYLKNYQKQPQSRCVEQMCSTEIGISDTCVFL